MESVAGRHGPWHGVRLTGRCNSGHARRVGQRPALAPTGHAPIDQLAIAFKAGLRAQAKALHDAGPEAFDQHVGAVDEFQQHFSGAGLARVNRNAATTAPEQTAIGIEKTCRLTVVDGMPESSTTALLRISPRQYCARRCCRTNDSNGSSPQPMIELGPHPLGRGPPRYQADMAARQHQLFLVERTHANHQKLRRSPAVPESRIAL